VTLGHRVKTELREVAELMDAAEQIADGLVDLLDHAYKHDNRTSPALAAANLAAVEIGKQREVAWERVR
jgi:hypothetical protein